MDSFSVLPTNVNLEIFIMAASENKFHLLKTLFKVI